MLRIEQVTATATGRLNRRSRSTCSSSDRSFTPSVRIGSVAWVMGASARELWRHLRVRLRRSAPPEALRHVLGYFFLTPISS
jgi:hypothetical protein